MPISTPGWDNAPYTSSSHFITADPDTGIQNMGNYRGMIKAPDRMGMNTSIELRTGGYMHWVKWKERGKPMPCAVVLGCPPAVSYTAVQKVPEIYDELDVTGGLIGRPLNVVKCKTVDLLVPAEAEVIIEGYVSTEFLEPEAPFGESHGHVNLQEYNGFMDVTAITRRKDAVITSWVSQVTPSESSCIKRPAYEAAQMLHLKNNLGIQGVVKVITHEPLTSLHKLIVIQFETEHQAHRNLARALRRRLVPPRRGQVDRRGRQGHRRRQLRRDLLGDVVPLQAAPRRQDAGAQGRGPRPAQPDRQRGLRRC